MASVDEYASLCYHEGICLSVSSTRPRKIPYRILSIIPWYIIVNVVFYNMCFTNTVKILPPNIDSLILSASHSCLSNPDTTLLTAHCGIAYPLSSLVVLLSLLIVDMCVHTAEYETVDRTRTHFFSEHLICNFIKCSEPLVAMNLIGAGAMIMYLVFPWDVVKGAR